MSLITITDLGKDYGPDTVLHGISLRLARGEKVGIIGKNGGGKTTLLRLILGIEEPTRGKVSVARGIRIGYLSQIARLDDSKTILEEAETALASVADAEARLREAELALASEPENEDLLDALGAAQDRYEFSGGEAARASLLASLEAMGLPEKDWDKPVSVLSGGEKTRLSMAKLLATTPDVLALDEPTNHLDIRAVEWLEGFLQRFPGAVLLVSHDRRFLENTANAIWDVEATCATPYSGGYTFYREKRERVRTEQLELYQRQQAEIARTEEYIRRNKAGQNTRIAMGRQKRLDRLERLERPDSDPQGVKAKLATSGRSGENVVVAEKASKKFGDQPILDKVDFILRRDQKIGIVGPNGTGKTTLIELLLGEQPLDSGYLKFGHGVTVAVHRQDEDDFEGEEIVLDAFYERAGLTIAEARSHLAKFLFTGDDVFKPISALSGGERSKLRMALMVLSPANLLVLDEPTNHLDVWSCDALTDALKSFPSTLLVVSHDRALLDAVTDHTLAFEGNGKVALHEGNYALYRAAQRASALPALRATPSRPDPRSVSQEGVKPSAFQLSKERARLQKRVAALEEEISKLESELTSVESTLASGEGDAIAQAAEHTRLSNALEARMSEWEQAAVDISVGD